MSTPVGPVDDAVRTTVCPHGPLLVRGADSWPGPDGESVPATRPVVAVCRCSHSQRLPWCDGTHKVVPRGWDSETVEAERQGVGAESGAPRAQLRAAE